MKKSVLPHDNIMHLDLTEITLLNGKPRFHTNLLTTREFW